MSEKREHRQRLNARIAYAAAIEWCNRKNSIWTPQRVKTLLMRIPAADVEPVRHGEWLLKHIGHGHYWECSECHTNPCIYVTKDTKFCPNCGAKMDLEVCENDS